MPTALEAGIQKVGAKIWILGWIRTLFRAISGAKI
jgi:hypothetical protein